MSTSASRRFPRFIGLCGRSGAGKDVVAGHLVSKFGYRRIAVADHLKRVTLLAFGMTDEQLWGANRNTIDPRWGSTPREIYQRLGDALRTIHPEALIMPWRDCLSSAASRDERIVVPDVRMPAEADVLKSFGGVVWRIVRPVAILRGAAGEHLTETSCDKVVTDADMPNSGTIGMLLGRVDQMLECEAARSG